MTTRSKILKPTAIMVSHADMKDLAHTCPGHATHRVVAGKCKDGENVNCKTARYTHEFCRKWLSCVCHRSQLCSFACLEDPDSLTRGLDDWRLTHISHNCQVPQDEWVDFPWSHVDDRERKVQESPWTGETRFWILPQDTLGRQQQSWPPFCTICLYHRESKGCIR